MGQCYPSKTCQRSSFYDLPAHSLPAHNHSLTAPRGRKSSTRRPHHSYPPHNFHTMYKRSQIVNKQLFLNSGFMEDDYIYSPYQPDPSIISENTTYITETSANRSVPNQHVVSATFAYSATSTCHPTFRVNSDNKVPNLVFDITDPAPNCTTSKDNHYPRTLAPHCTTSRDNHYPRTLAPHCTTSRDNHYPRTLAPHCTTSRDNHYPRTLAPHCTTSRDNHYPRTLAPHCTTSRDNHYPRTLAEDHALPVVTRVSLDSMNSDKSSTSHPRDIGRHGDKPLETVAYF